QVDSYGILFGCLEIGATYNPLMVDHDAQKLKEYYQSFGYQDVNVTRELSFEDDFRLVNVIFHVHEGQRYQVAAVQVDGPKALDRAQVASYVKLRQGDYYSEQVVETDLRTITDAYGWRGYPVTANKELVFQDQGHVLVRYE